MNKTSQELKDRLILIVITFVSLIGCSGRELTMLHPDTGQVVTCRAEGMGLFADAMTAESLEECRKEHIAKGYRPTVETTVK